MTTVTSTDARKDFFEMIKGANERHEIFRIRHRSGDAVLMSQKEYDALLETLYLQSSRDFKKLLDKSQKQADEGDTFSFEEVFGEAQ